MKEKKKFMHEFLIISGYRKLQRDETGEMKNLQDQNIIYEI